VLCRIADGAAGHGREAGEGFVGVPLGLAGLYWIRLFKPLLAADLRQSPTNRGLGAIGFVGAGYRALGALSPPDMRIGAAFERSILDR